MKYEHLTVPQQNIWNLQKYYEDTAISNLCGAVFYNEKRDSTLLQQAVLHFIQSQSALRLRFCEKEEPKQYVVEQNNEIIPVMTFSSMKEFDTFAERFAKEPLGLIDCPMYRFVVFQVEDKSGILVLLSHLISDAWTFGLMANQLDEAYHKLKEGIDVSLVEGDYTDYIQSEDTYMQSERYNKDKDYWEGKYATRPEESPIKLRTVSSESIAAKRITRTLPLSLEQKIEEYCRVNSVTQAVLFETALISYLSKINSENQTVTIGVPVLNRSNAKEKSIAGMFIATMPLTVVMTDGMTTLELSKQITKGHMDLFRHQKYSYSSILKNLREKQNFSGNLYDVMISYQNAKTHSVADTKWYCNGYSEVPLVIHIDNRDEKDCHTINVDYQTEVFRDEAEVAYIMDRLEYILEQIVEDSAKTIKDIGIVPERELEKIIYQFNDTYVDYPREKCVHELFSEQAERTPEKTALVFEDKKFTYRQLDEMSNSLACFLRDKGVGYGDMVAVLLKRDERVIIAQLAVLKLGAVFIPIDSRYPKERVDYIINESHARILLKNQDNSMYFPVECCVEEWDSQFVEEFDLVQTSSDDACYAIFTSGSTGKPKGCLLTQKGLVNFCTNLNILKYSNQLENKICISVNTISFDMFILESLLPLVNGYTIVLANEEQSVNREAFKTLLCNSHANIIQTTPTKYKIFFDPSQENAYAEQLDIIASSGEVLPLELLRSFLENTDAKIFNPMGPSECTIYVLGGEMSSLKKEVQQTDITLGRPIANTQIYVLDKNNMPLPIGVAGELCTAGEGVGKGYLNRLELTAERFVPNPFATEENHHGKVMYRTGDLARWRADGEIEYLGRIDTQVKIRGLRIELGEIESVMGGFEGIGLTAVSDKRDENNRQYLVGYYTSDTEVEEKRLREYLSAKLPKYMVPNYFMRLTEMPMTPSGKIDRKNLPVPDFTVQGAEYVEPTTDTEKKIAMIWQELLHVEKVGKMDDFFELGGDSLLAIAMLGEIEKVFGAEISIRDIMEKSSLEQLAQCIEQSHTVSRIPACHEKKYVLLPQQKAIYAVYSKNPDTLAYNMPAKIRLTENIDRDMLKQSICQVLNHHEILKSHIEADENEIYGVYDEDAQIVFEEYQNGHETAFVRPFDLGKAPLVRIGFTEDALLFDMHHIVADGDSLNIILRDIVLTYEGNVLPESEITFSDYAKYFYALNIEEHKAFYKKMLKCDFEPVLLPETKNAGEGGKSKVYQIPEDIFSTAKKYARENGLTETMVFLGA